jgi:phosphocarrier protein FPr
MGLFSSLFSKPVSVELVVTSSNGFHLRPIAQFVTVAKQYPCKISATFEGKTVDAKSVNTLLSLSLEKGSRFKLTIQGKRSVEALETLQNNFTTLMQDDIPIETIQKEETLYESPTIEGQIICTGIAIASAYHYQEKALQKETHITFKEAIEKSIEELEKLYHSQNNHADIYLAQKELLASLQTNTETLLVLEELIEKKSTALLGTKLEAKISDYSDILQRVQRHLGLEREALFPKIPFILLADDLLPSQIEKLSQTKVKGVVLKETSINSHTAILLRGAGIPSLIAETAMVTEQTSTILDAHSGLLVTNPTEEDLHKAEERRKNDTTQREVASSKRFETAMTKKGKSIKVLANITDVPSATRAKEEGAEGIGLLRTEFLFKEKKPTLAMQIDAYEKIFAYFDEITLRTLDVGGDKALPYIDLPKENNPFLGIRGIRLFQTHPQIIEEQLHAIFKASKHKPLKIMFPMVSAVDEFNEAKIFAKKVAQKHHLSIDHIQFGIMIEVPSTLFLIESFNAVVDFYSIGTNDLAQYLFAIERTHPVLKIDESSSVLFDAIDTIIKKADKPISICGELAGKSEAIPKLLNLGIEILSVSSAQIAQTKEEIRNHV